MSKIFFAELPFTLFLIGWFFAGNYFVLGIWDKVELYDSNNLVNTFLG